MKHLTALIGMVLLSACGVSNDNPTLRGLQTADEQMSPHVASSTAAHPVDSLAPPNAVVERARKFLFMQVDLYQGGANTSPDYALAEMLALMGREDLIAPIEEKGLGQCPRRWVDPIDSIAQSAGTARVVIVVEQPHRSRQRAFIRDVANELIDIGFDHYASDGFDLSNPPLNLTEFAKLDEGLFVREPMFGRLVRDLKARDVKFLSLDLLMPPVRDAAPETRAQHESDRRNMQADRLALKILNRDPDARVIVHLIDPNDSESVKYSNEVDYPIKQFAERLKGKTGETPLILGQTKCRSVGTGSVMLPNLGRGGRFVDKYGIVVAHPIDTLKNGRPQWRRARGDLDVDVPDLFSTQFEPVIVEARRVDDPEISVPEDRLLLLPGDHLPLLLPAGRYRIEGWTKNGPIAGPVEIDVQ